MNGPVIVGDQITLTPPPAGFAALLRDWYSDPIVTRYLALRFPPSLQGMEDWLRKLAASSANVVWAIIADERPVGILMIHEINWRKRQGAIGMCIGERDTWSKGYGSEAAILLTRFAFQELGLEKITGSLLTGNAASQRMMERVGYRQYGLARHDEFRHGHWQDAWLCEALRDEWLAEYPASPET